MASDKSKDWRAIRAEPLNPRRLAFHGRMLEAEERLDQLRRARGLSEDDLGRAIAVDLGPGDEDQLFRLARYVELLGGRLELRAVFPGETVTLLEPEAPRP